MYLLVPPTSIEITGHSNSSVVGVKQGESVSLECVVQGGKPRANIKWKRKNIELKTGKKLF